jgi:transcriptional regulator with XRE-family HTH domain
VKGGELRRFREEQGWSQDDLAKLLKASLGKGSGTTIGKWENEQRPVPEDVAALVAQLQLEAAMPGEPPLDESAFGLDSGPSPVEGEAGDTAPPEPGEQSRDRATAGQLPLSTSTSYGRVCEELWELVATGVGMIGAVTGSDGLRRDGEIILADKQALGRAWGKLAETNDTFRRLLLSTTTSGAWLEVAMVSGITFGKCYRSHQAISLERAVEHERAVAEWQAEHGEVAEVGFADAAAA